MITAIDDAALRYMALTGPRPRLLERDRRVTVSDKDGSRTYEWSPPEPRALQGGEAQAAVHPGQFLELVELILPTRVPNAPRHQFQSRDELVDAMLLPDDELRAAPAHEEPWGRHETFDDDGAEGPGPRWAHIDAEAAAGDDPFALHDPPGGSDGLRGGHAGGHGAGEHTAGDATPARNNGEGGGDAARRTDEDGPTASTAGAAAPAPAPELTVARGSCAFWY